MLIRIILICYLCFILEIKGTIYKENITDFSKCEVHISRSEGKYSKFYEINKDEKPENNSLVLDFHFSVLARSDAHILLAENDVLQSTDPVYEIVIGAGGNTFTDLRRLQKSSVKVTAWFRDLLSVIDVRSFWIHVWNDGLIEVGRETEELAFLAWKDPNLLNLKFFSFSTWPGVEAKWFFDCERNIIKKSELILTDYERLKQDLFQNYSIFIRPVLNESDMTDVELRLAPQYVSLDEHSSKILIRGTGNMKWTDEKLTWNLDDYGGIELLKLPTSMIWTPDLRLYDLEVGLQHVVLYKNGSVFCSVLLDMVYWCNIEDLGSWPSDVHKCSLSFNFMRDSDKISLQFLSKTEDFFRLPLASEWNVINVDIKYGLVDESVDFIDDELPSITLLLTLKRTSNIYRLIYLTPFFVIGICSLCTFWASPFGYLKITLCCIQLIIESIILIHFSIIIPGHSIVVPNLLILYSSSLIGTVVSVIISIVVINLSRNKHDSMPWLLHRVLSSNFLGLLFLSNTKHGSSYGKISGTQTKTKEAPIQSMWILLATIIDKIAFVIYFVLFIFAILQQY